MTCIERDRRGPCQQANDNVAAAACLRNSQAICRSAAAAALAATLVSSSKRAEAFVSACRTNPLLETASHSASTSSPITGLGPRTEAASLLPSQYSVADDRSLSTPATLLFQSPAGHTCKRNAFEGIYATDILMRTAETKAADVPHCTEFVDNSQTNSHLILLNKAQVEVNEPKGRFVESSPSVPETLHINRRDLDPAQDTLEPTMEEAQGINGGRTEAKRRGDGLEDGCQVRYGIIGTGMMGVEHIHNLACLDGALITAISDPHGPSLKAALAALGGRPNVQVFSSHQDLLASGLCDVLVVASPNMTHAQILVDILKFDARAHHVLVEKPLCTTIDACQQVLAAAAARPDILLQVGLEYRHMPPVARLIREVRAGAIGRVRMVAIREHRFPFLEKVNHWNRFSRNTGGTLVEKCCHFFDLMNLIVGRQPLRVIASGSQAVNHLDESYDGQVPDILDNAYVIVEYEGGARGMLDLCMFAEGSRNEQELSVSGDAGKIEALVPEGVVRIGRREEGRAGVLTIAVEDPRIKYEGLHHGSSYLEHLEFLASVRSHGELPPTVTLEEGMMAVAIGIAGHRSIELGRPVLLKEVLDREV
eukprot:TRINITY_DN10469_c0_g1_i1.p1 TRINITY_DN10469_c0_g1~~TRINITY_DN10469_c0_g1_i1.p1  ORF type:complete len:594 (+),score=70.09 TRINITY_DN10469_c0_g1_i1:416-2197(+)